MPHFGNPCRGALRRAALSTVLRPSSWSGAHLPRTGDETTHKLDHLTCLAQLGRVDRVPLCPRGPVMSFALTQEQHLLLELIADRPLPAIAELQRHTAPLAATKL